MNSSKRISIIVDETTLVELEETLLFAIRKKGPYILQDNDVKRFVTREEFLETYLNYAIETIDGLVSG